MDLPTGGGVWTYNRSNGSALNKLMTTRFPASAALVELAAYTEKSRLLPALRQRGG